MSEVKFEVQDQGALHAIVGVLYVNGQDIGALWDADMLEPICADLNARESRLAELESLAKKSLLLMKEEHEMRTQESGGAFFPGGWLDHINELSAALSTSEAGNG